MDQVIAQMISTATIALAVFGIVFSLTQTEYSRVSRSFAAFLAAVAVNNVPDAFSGLIPQPQDASISPTELLIWLPSALCLAPLFWIYVVTVTSKSQRGPARLYRHFVLPTLAVLGALLMLFAPQGLWGDIVEDDIIAVFGWWSALLVGIALLQVAVYPQMAIYLFLILRRMMRYRPMLRDVYASTEEHELRWIYVIGALGVLFWIGQTLILVLAFDPDAAQTTTFLVITGAAGLGLVATTILWGLRQRPPLVPDGPTTRPPDSPQGPPSGQGAEKYEKSALSAEASSRIARKLRVAMEQDHLHRDPNLSLWALARHIGASPNYISQTLNEAVGESFFDFVNGYRIAEAKTRLSTTDDTVLTITYDVGFNARSSFYNAFKRVTGQTPTDYRKTLSRRDGMDDMKAALREV